MINLLQIQTDDYVLPSWVLPVIFIIVFTCLLVGFVLIVRASRKDIGALKERERELKPLPNLDEAEIAISDDEYPFDQYFKK